LDSKSADGVFNLLQSVCAELGTTVLFVTHNPLLSARCKKTIEVVDGRVR
jgi:lipoprotein-releasing system ATP-binding protein